MHLYPKVKVQAQSFKGVKKHTVPNQSLGLREIIKRFVRRESLPVSKDGLYEERFGDIEKISRLDITEQMEVVQDLKEKIARFERNMEAQEKKREEEAAKKRYEAEALAKSQQSQEEEPKPDKGKAAQKSPPKGGT